MSGAQATPRPASGRTRRCGTCGHFEGGNTKAAEVLGVQSKGACHRYPVPTHKLPADWCGEWTAQEPAK